MQTHNAWRAVADELARRTDIRRVVVRRLEVAAPECRQSTGVVGELGDQVGAALLRPARDLVGQLAGEGVVAAHRGDERAVVAQHGHVQPQARVLADLEGFGQHLLELVPLAGQEVVQAHEVQRGGDQGPRAGRARALHRAPEGPPASARAVDEHRGQRDLAEVPRVGLVIELRDDLVEAIEHREGAADRIGHRQAGQQQVLGDVWPEAIEDREVRSPQVGAAGEAADEEQQVDGRRDILVRRIELVALSVDGSDQQPVDRLQVAIAVEQHEGGSHVRLQRAAGPGLGFQRLGDDLLAVAQAPRQVHARRTPPWSAGGCGRRRPG